MAASVLYLVGIYNRLLIPYGNQVFNKYSLKSAFTHFTIKLYRMVILEQFFHLTEQNHNIISNIWRILPMTFITIASVSGICYAIIFGVFKSMFSNRCIFFSLFYNEATDKDSMAIDSRAVNRLLILSRNITDNSTDGEIQLSNEIEWSSPSTCDFLQFTPILCSIFGIAILSLFVMFGKGGNSAKNGLRSPWRIVVPSLLSTTLFSIFCIVTLRYFTDGMYIFCADFVANSAWMTCGEVLNTVSLKIIKESAKMNNRKKFTSEDDPLNETTHLLQMEPNELAYVAECFLGLAMAAWILCALFLIIRITTVVDFQLVKISVQTVEVMDAFELESQLDGASEKFIKRTDMEGPSNLSIFKAPHINLNIENPSINLMEEGFFRRSKKSDPKADDTKQHGILKSTKGPSVSSSRDLTTIKPVSLQGKSIASPEPSKLPTTTRAPSTASNRELSYQLLKPASSPKASLINKDWLQSSEPEKTQSVMEASSTEQLSVLRPTKPALISENIFDNFAPDIENIDDRLSTSVSSKKSMDTVVGGSDKPFVDRPTSVPTVDRPTSVPTSSLSTVDVEKLFAKRHSSPTIFDSQQKSRSRDTSLIFMNKQSPLLSTEKISFTNGKDYRKSDQSAADKIPVKLEHMDQPSSPKKRLSESDMPQIFSSFPSKKKSTGSEDSSNPSLMSAESNFEIKSPIIHTAMVKRASTKLFMEPEDDEKEKPETAPVLRRPQSLAEDDDQTETEALTRPTEQTDMSPDVSHVTLASPEPLSEESPVEMVEIQNEKRKTPKITFQNSAI